MKLRRVFAPIVILSLSTGVGGWLLQQSEPAAGTFYAQSRLFDDVRELVSAQFVDSVPEARLYRDATEGLVKGLGDPHTALFNPKRRSDFEVTVNGQYGGVGLRVGKSSDRLTVTLVIANTPAERAGVLAGDRIVEIDGQPTRGWSVDTASAHLRGRSGTPVLVAVERAGTSDPVQFTITREAVRLSSVNAVYMLDRGVGYVSVGQISDGSGREVQQALRQLRSQGMRNVILDLRGNGGGYLQEAVNISSLFIDPNRMVVETRGRTGQDNQKYFTGGRSPEFGDVQVAVLVDGFTASAAEIVAGAIQDHDRGMLIGQRTFGKGVAQLMFPMPGGYALKMTTERWYTPSGRSIQKAGAPIGDTTAAPVDSSYRSLGGRTLAGGGGIVPDIVMLARDSSTMAERKFDVTVLKPGFKYGETLFEFAVGYRARHPELNRDFTLPTAALDEFYNALGVAGVNVDRATFDAAARINLRRLEVQVALVTFGEREARRRANFGDHEIEKATDLLSRAQSSRELLQLAATASHRG